MKFRPVLSIEPVVEKDILAEEFKAGREFGRVCVGKDHFFYRTKLTINYISYKNVERVFRRVECIDMKMCCAAGEIQLHSIVICAADSELAAIEVPTEGCAIAILKHFEDNWPSVKIGKKSKED